MADQSAFTDASEGLPEPMPINANGPALVRWLEAELRMRPDGLTPGTWGRKTGVVSEATVSRWRDGLSEPSIDALERVAEELGRPLLDLMVAAQMLTPEQAGGHVPKHTEPWTPEDAITLDHTLTEHSKKTLLDILAAFRSAQRGDGPDDLTIEIEL